MVGLVNNELEIMWKETVSVMVPGIARKAPKNIMEDLMTTVL
jgi:hypothetical protein